MQENTTKKLMEQGLQVKAQGNPEQALSFFKQAMQSGSPDDAELLYLVGDTLHDLGRLDEAIAHLQRAREIDPQYVNSVYTLAVVLQDRGKLEEAISCYRAAEVLRPDHAKTHNNMGSAYLQLNRRDEAISCFKKALQLDPKFFMANYNLGSAYYLDRQFSAAKQCFQRVLTQQPTFAQAHNNYANLLKDEGQLKLAADEYRLAIRHNPSLAEAHFNLANVLMKIWHIEEALVLLEQLIKINPQHAIGYSNYLFYAHYSDRFNLEDFYRMACNWEKSQLPEISKRIGELKFTNNPDPERKLKIGYVSADFCLHPVGFFLEGVFASHDKSLVEIYCYYNYPKQDAQTAYFVSQSDHWRDIHGVSDEKVDALIRQDEIDIMVDLTGHTDENRMLLLAGKPAPIQVTWLGYCDTTGLQSMDYLLADETVIPSGTNQKFSESVWHLPECYINYVPREYSPEIDDASANTNHPVTFGCFNNLSKITESMLQLWSRILHGVENSQILIRCPQFKDVEISTRVTAVLLQNGINPERIMLEHNYLEHRDFLGRYKDVDISLDTSPYNGVTTTCDSLWMGVPVVTLLGEHFISRNSASILNAVGLPELIATSPQQYINIAIDLANQPSKRNSIKSVLRKNFGESVLGDSIRFTRNLEEAYRKMWRKWCIGENN